MEKLDLYYIDLKYIRNLSNADDNVMSISPQREKRTDLLLVLLFLLMVWNIVYR